MKMENTSETGETQSDLAARKTPKALSPPFVRNGLESMFAFSEEIVNLKESILDIESLGGPEAKKKAQKLLNLADGLEPSITMIGQIKSGKTSLVNAMVGRPELLPADVNPWTSVVSSLHLNAKNGDDDTVASFQFFNQDEWDNLVKSGGRIGELSSRAGAENELQKVREQISQVYEKTKTRLGRKFELLLGQTHTYRHFDEDLMQRYVCMGDDFGDPELLDDQGQFADITKSADLYLEAPCLPMSLCIRDTPGVNDTFMMREQITINSLRGSRICVVVLSASQALSSMDMGLIRLISNIKAREVVIFVNRIDELANPSTAIPEIKASILKTLADHNGLVGIEVVFGSAYWANVALTENVQNLVSDSEASLRNYLGDDLAEGEELKPETVWNMSGMPELYDAISTRVVQGEGAEMLTSIRKRATNQLLGLKVSSSIVTMRLGNEELSMMDPEILDRRLIQIRTHFRKVMGDEIDKILATYTGRVDQTHVRFLDRALESLLQHLETNGANEVWQYSPDGLRILLRSSYQSMRKSVAATCTAVFDTAAEEFSKTYKTLLSIELDGFAITPPSAPKFPPPVTLGQTIAMDLQTSWWKGWWERRKSHRAHADAYYKLIEAETTPIVDALKHSQVEEIRRIAMTELDDFLSEQTNILTDVSRKTQISEQELKSLFGITEQDQREELFDILLEELATDDIVEEEENERPGRPTRPSVSKDLNQIEKGAA
jgi:hypothetical protein